jgi:hypothetical protein
MNHLSSCCVMLAAVVGILTVEPANACCMGPSMAPVGPPPSIGGSVPRPPDVSGSVNSATNAVNSAAASATRAMRDKAERNARNSAARAAKDSTAQAARDMARRAELDRMNEILQNNAREREFKIRSDGAVPNRLITIPLGKGSRGKQVTPEVPKGGYDTTGSPF